MVYCYTVLVYQENQEMLNEKAIRIITTNEEQSLSTLFLVPERCRPLTYNNFEKVESMHAVQAFENGTAIFHEKDSSQIYPP